MSLNSARPLSLSTRLKAYTSYAWLGRHRAQRTGLYFSWLCIVGTALLSLGCAMQAEMIVIRGAGSAASAPASLSVSPTAGSVGTMITLTGQDFTLATAVSVNGTQAVIVSQSASSLTAVIMPGTTSGNASVTIGGSPIASAAPFTVSASSPPLYQQGTKLVATGAALRANQGRSVSLSADSNTLAVGGNLGNAGATWIFTRSGSTWTQQGTKLEGTGAVGSSGQGRSVSLSADGNTLAVGGPGDDSAVGATWIFTRSGSTWTQQGAKLVGTGAVGAANQGTSVALSSDGNTLAVGAIEDDSQIGATWIFTRSGSTWTQQGAKLAGTGVVGVANQGNAVSLNADGNTLAVGGWSDDSYAGATWIFTRSGSTWTQQGTKLVGTGGVGLVFQGTSVDLSADGDTLAVGGFYDNSSAGATWVFTRSGSTWTQQGTKLVGTGAVGAAQQGVSVSLSADGNTLAIGGRSDNGSTGANWVFTRSGSTWTQQGTKLVGTGAVGAAEQGWSVSLSADGDTLAFGGYADNAGLGANWAYTRSGSTWTQQGTKLVGSGALEGPARQARTVSLSADGNTLAVGGDLDGGGAGATWIFTRSGSTWTQQGAKLVGTGAVGNSNQGISVSLSADGNTLAVGGYSDNSNTGATWIFTRSGSTWTQQGAKLVGSGAVGAAYQGINVGLSANGSTLAVGGYGDNGFAGATWVFTRSGSTWTQQGAKLVGSGAVGAAYQGISVSLNASGNTLAIGGYGDNSAAGATWVFTRSGSTWSQQGSKLVGTGAVGTAYQGNWVSLSADGNTLAASGLYDDTGVGATWVYTRSGSTWTQQGSKLVGTGGVGAGQQGICVSLSADGNTLAVGSAQDNSGVGASWVYTRSGSTWTQQGAKLVGTGAVGTATQGVGVSLSADGSTLAVGGYGDNGSVGATWIFAP